MLLIRLSCKIQFHVTESAYFLKFSYAAKQQVSSTAAGITVVLLMFLCAVLQLVPEKWQFLNKTC